MKIFFKGNAQIISPSSLQGVMLTFLFETTRHRTSSWIWSVKVLNFYRNFCNATRRHFNGFLLIKIDNERKSGISFKSHVFSKIMVYVVLRSLCANLLLFCFWFEFLNIIVCFSFVLTQKILQGFPRNEKIFVFSIFLEKHHRLKGFERGWLRNVRNLIMTYKNEGIIRYSIWMKSKRFQREL